MLSLDVFKGIFGEKGLAGNVIDVLKSTGVLKDPEAVLKAEQALRDYEVKMEEIAAKTIESVNATMREEAKSEHWIQYSWRPLVGFTFAGVIINNYILVPYFSTFIKIQPLVIPDGIWSAMLVVLGVAAGTRGLEKWQKEKGK